MSLYNSLELKQHYSPVELNFKGNDQRLAFLVDRTLSLMAAENKKTVEKYLNGYSKKQIHSFISAEAKNEKDVRFIIELYVEHAEQLIARYNNENKLSDSRCNDQKMTFAEMLALKRKYPQETVAKLMAYLVAIRRDDLKEHADKLLTPSKKALPLGRSAVNRTYGDVCSAWQKGVIKIEKLDPAAIYAQTNRADEEAYKTFVEKKAQNKEAIRKKRYQELANKELEYVSKKDEVCSDEDLLRSKLKLLLETAG